MPLQRRRTLPVRLRMLLVTLLPPRVMPLLLRAMPPPRLPRRRLPTSRRPSRSSNVY